MIKVLDIFPIGDKISVTLEGNCDRIKNGSKLIGADNTEFKVLSVATTRNDNPADFSKTTTVLMPNCNIKRGYELKIA